MKTAFSWFFVCFALIFNLFLAGCASPSRPPVVAEPDESALFPMPAVGQTTRMLVPRGEFDQIVMEGNLDAEITGHALQNDLRVTGSPKALQQVYTRTVNHVLYINNDNANQAGNKVTLHLKLSQNPDAINYQGHGRIILKNIGDSSMKLILGGHAFVSIHGNNLVLSRIEASDNALVHAYWLNTSNLQIIAKNQAKVFLAGVADNVNIIGSGDADIDAQYLRAQNAYVRANDDTDINISVARALSLWVSQHASVYYYRDPALGITYLDGSGAALRMTGLKK